MKHHDFSLPDLLHAYAKERGIEYHRYSEYHMRLIYGKTAIIDCWTTGKYWIMKTDYMHGIIERGGEKGWLPHGKNRLYNFLDKVLFAVEMKEEVDASRS